MGRRVEGPAEPAAETAGERQPRRRGRPSGARTGESAATRERIRQAARGVFAELGYDKASIRAIARAARVDPALVHHYFGAKEQVFEAAVELSLAPAAQAREVLAGGSAGVGERLARYFIGVWEDPATRAPLLAVLRSAVTNEAAAKVLRGFVLRRLLHRVTGELDLPDAALRAQLAAAQMIGVAMMRYVLEVEPLATATADEVVAYVAPTLQSYLGAPDRDRPAPDRNGVRPVPAGTGERLSAVRTERPDRGPEA